MDTINPEHYRNGVAYAVGYARNYGLHAVLRAIRNPSKPPQLSTSAPDFVKGVIDGALALAQSEVR